MDYEIKYINLGPLLKISFLVILTVICISLFFMHLFILRIIDLFRESLHTFSQFDFNTLSGMEIGLGGIILSSIFNGVLLTILLVFLLILAGWFYNIYTHQFGGIQIRLKAMNGYCQSAPAPEIAEKSEGQSNTTAAGDQKVTA